MQFKTETTVLKEALNKLGMAINPKALLPSLINVHTEIKQGNVILTSCDLHVTIQYHIICETDGEGSFLFPFNEMKNIVALESGVVTLSWSVESGCVATFEKDVFNLGKQDTADYPKQKTIAESKMITLESSLLPAIRMAALSVGKDDLRPAMMRICLELSEDKATVVSTDSHCLYAQELVFTTKATETVELLMPAVVAKVLDDDLYPVLVGYNKQLIAFKSGPVTVISMRSEHKFPNWKALLPAHNGNLTIPLSGLKDAVNKAYVVSDSTYNGIDFKLSKDRVSVESENTDMGMSCRLEVEAISGSEVDHIRFNGRLLKRMMQQLEGADMISFSINGAIKPVTITRLGDNSTTVLIMPITITQ